MVLASREVKIFIQCQLSSCGTDSGGVCRPNRRSARAQYLLGHAHDTLFYIALIELEQTIIRFRPAGRQDSMSQILSPP